MFVPIRNLAQLGIIPDVPAYDLPPNAFSDGENVVFRHKKVEKAPGWRSVALAPAPTETLYWFQSWESAGQVKTAFFGNGKIWVWDGALFDEKVTDVDGVGTPIGPSVRWASDIFGEFVVASNRSDPPLYFDEGSDEWVPLPGYEDIGNGALAEPCATIRPYKSLLFAIGLPNKPYTLAWSDIGKLGELPTNWAITDTSSFAGTLELQANDGEIVDAAQLGDYLIVYTRRAAYAANFTGNVRNPITVRRLFSWGLAAIECVKSYENMHFCVTNDIIYVHDGTRIQRIADNRVEERIFDAELANTRSMKVAVIPSEHEILLYYKRVPVDNPEEDPPPPADRIVRYNWREDSWSFENPETAIYCIRQTLVPGEITTWDDLTAAGTTWQDLANNGTTWQELNGRGESLAPFQIDQLTDFGTNPPTALDDPNWSQREEGLTRNGVNYYGWIERKYIDLDELTKTNEGLIEIHRLMPQLTGSGDPIYFQIGSSMGPGAPIVWEEPIPWDFSAEQYKIDTRTLGRYLAWRIGTWPESTFAAGGGAWQLSGMDIDILMDGRR